MYAGRGSGGFHFTNEKPEIGLQPTGVYSGISGQDLLLRNFNVPAFNSDVKSWGRKVARLLRAVVRSQFTHGKKEPRTYKTGIHAGTTEKKLAGSIRAHYRKEQGGEQIDTIAFSLERHGVFLQKGVGSGYLASGGGVARIAKTEDVNRFRFKNDWFNSTLEKNTNDLKEIIIKHTGDAIVLNTKRMFIL